VRIKDRTALLNAGLRPGPLGPSSLSLSTASGVGPVVAVAFAAGFAAGLLRLWTGGWADGLSESGTRTVP
jgi:hypothetical protein